MKKIVIVAAFSFLVFGFLMTKEAFAYRGDPSKKGPYCNQEQYQAVQQAIKNKDFNTWKKLMENKPIARIIDTKEKFEKFIKMREYKLQGKYQEAYKLKEELGLGKGRGFGNWK